MPRLLHKFCIVTGAARGIGAAIAQAFLEEGARVLLTDKDVPNGQKRADELGVDFRELDVSREDHWQALAQAHP
ncbi:MAG TPA: SDR family oxidoreductase, partial [Hellea balneolensis]|nr:SDR family oxidoreductase [Hellea balneolensis]